MSRTSIGHRVAFKSSMTSFLRTLTCTKLVRVAVLFETAAFVSDNFLYSSRRLYIRQRCWEICSTLENDGGIVRGLISDIGLSGTHLSTLTRTNSCFSISSYSLSSNEKRCSNNYHWQYCTKQYELHNIVNLTITDSFRLKMSVDKIPELLRKELPLGISFE